MTLEDCDFVDRMSDRFWSKVDKSGTCWMWTAGHFKNGYGAFSVRCAGHSAPLYAHRVSYLLDHGSVPESALVLHHCDTRGCVRPEHLFLGTPGDNTRDMVKKGRHVGNRGWSGTARTKLNREQVARIRALHADGWTQPRIAALFGVCRATIGFVVRRHTWRDS